MRKICYWLGVTMATIVLAFMVVFLTGPEVILAGIFLIVATKTALYVNSWIDRRIGDSKCQYDYEEEFIFIGKVFFCLIAAVIAALIATLVTLLLLYALFNYIIMPILSLTS